MGRQGTPRTDASRASLTHRLGAYVSAHRQRRRWFALMGVLAAVVVVITAGALMVPASTMTQDDVAEQQQTTETTDAQTEGASEQEAAPEDEAVPEDEATADAEAASDGEAAPAEEAASDNEAAPVEEADAEKTDEAVAPQDEADDQAQVQDDSEATQPAEQPEADQTGDAEQPSDDTSAQKSVLTYDGDSYTVKVSYGEDAQLPEDVKLQVTEYAKDSEEYQARYSEAAQMNGWSDDVDESNAPRLFNISFVTEEGKEVEPAAPVSVSIAYQGEVMSDETSVLHFGDENTEQLDATVDENNGTQSVSFDVDSFSDFMVFAPQAAPVANDSTDDPASGDQGASGGTTSNDDGAGTIMSEVTQTGANEWQIVDGSQYVSGYQPESYIPNEPYNTSSDGNVRVKKSVIPTDVENEFLVHLSIDEKVVYNDYFETNIGARTPNVPKEEDWGKVGKLEGSLITVKTTPFEGNTDSAWLTILSNDGQVLVSETQIWWDHSSNYTFYLPIYTQSGGQTVEQRIILCSGIKPGSHNTIKLDQNASSLVESTVETTSLNRVEDTMGSHVQLVEIESVGNNDTVDQDGNTITWIPAPKSNPTTVDKNVTSGSESQIVGGTQTSEAWALDVAEIVYKVRLRVEDNDFVSCADHMEDSVCANAVNSKATLYYGGSDAPVDFPTPYVRGLLYDVTFSKIDKDTKEPLKGAVFGVSGGNDSGVNVSKSTTDNEDGTYKVEGVPWGTYTISETEAPAGYEPDENSSRSFSVCYTGNQGAYAQADDLVHMTPKNSGIDPIENKLSVVSLTLIKTDSASGQELNGAKFVLYQEDEDGTKQYYNGVGSDGKAIWSELTEGEQLSNYAQEIEGEFTFKGLPGTGTYYLQEVEAPDGYLLPENTYSVAFENGKPTPGDATAGLVVKDISTVDNPAYSVTVTNTTGTRLPDTGGSGTNSLIIGGLALIAAAGCGYGLRRRHEGRGARS